MRVTFTSGKPNVRVGLLAHGLLRRGKIRKAVHRLTGGWSERWQKHRKIKLLHVPTLNVQSIGGLPSVRTTMPLDPSTSLAIQEMLDLDFTADKSGGKKPTWRVTA